MPVCRHLILQNFSAPRSAPKPASVTVYSERASANRVAVIVTSDHGEDLDSRYESNRFDHGHALRDELVKVPLVLYDPARDDSGRVVEAPVRSIDILPTGAELLGVPVPGDHADGRSLLGLLDGEEQDERLALLGQTRWGPRRVGVRTADHKYIHQFSRSLLFESRQLCHEIAADKGDHYDGDHGHPCS